MIAKIKSWFKDKPKPGNNVHSEDFIDKVEKAVIIDGIQYYRFTQETNMPWGRYMYLQTYLYEQNLRLDVAMLKEYMTRLTKILNGNKGTIELGKAFQIIGQINSRCELAFEVDTTYRLAAVLYFDETEDLYGYNKPHNDKKIASWKEAKATDFFYTMPMSEFLGLSGSSPQDLLTFMETQKEILDALTSETSEP